jgi:hypothetical protein
MANWCYNRVEFTGSTFALTGVKLMFEELAEKERAEQQGQLPEFIEEKGGYFFDLLVEDEVIYYETRWSPNIDRLREIADYFDIGFIHNYEESGNCICGEATYKGKVLTEVDLDFEDFNLYKYDEEKDIYTFEGQSYECSDEIQKILLERKKHLNLNIKDNDTV